MNTTTQESWQPTEAGFRQIVWGKEMATEALDLLIGRAHDFDDDRREQFALITLVISLMISASAKRAAALDPSGVEHYCDYMTKTIGMITQKNQH